MDDYFRHQRRARLRVHLFYIENGRVRKIPTIHSTDGLIIVDMQNDFCPGGALPVKGGNEVVPVLNQWVQAAKEGGAFIVASRDWHPPEHISFKDQGGLWPPHCIQNTPGAEFHSQLNLPEQTQIISKGAQQHYDQYSAFDDTGLTNWLNNNGIERVWVGGLAQDVCVYETVIDGLDEGFEVHLILPATRPVNTMPREGQRALEEMREAGAIIER